MKPPAFDYLRAQELSEALQALEEYGGDARVLAGGQTLLPMLNMRLAHPRLVIDISRLPALNGVERAHGRLSVGAAVTQAQLEGSEAVRHVPLLAMALPWVGHAQTRAQGTVCGSIAHADPSAELPLCLLLLDGTVDLRSRKERRRVSAADFFVGMMTTDRDETELIEAVGFDAPAAGEGFGFAEVGRRHGDFAIVACAAKVHTDGITLAIGGVADTPHLRRWPHLEGSALDDAINEFAWELGARDDIHASARLRRDLARSLGRRTVEEAAGCRA